MLPESASRVTEKAGHLSGPLGILVLFTFHAACVHHTYATIAMAPGYTHPDTPKRQKLLTLIERNNIVSPSRKQTQRDEFAEAGFSNSAAYRVLKTKNPRRHHTQCVIDNVPDHRGSTPTIPGRTVNRMVEIAETGGFETRAFSHAQILAAADPDIQCCDRTIQRSLPDDYRKHPAALRKYVQPDLQQTRVQWCMGAQSWSNTRIKRTRWSDEVHFGLGPQKQLQIFRWPGETARLAPDAIQDRIEPITKKDREGKRIHVWAAAGYNFKSEIVFYDVPTNDNGKMNGRVYVDAILEPHVKRWLERGDDFILEEDGDSGHGLIPSKRNPAWVWKAAHPELEWFKNAPQSPDLSPIENCWQPLKEKIKREPHWNGEKLKREIVRVWDEEVSQEWINRMVMEWRDRLAACIERDGKMTGY
jgi:hypothetical protein